jgi:homoserine dehydrogenase
MYTDEIVVLKFGSSVLRSEADLPRAVHEIYRWLREGKQVLAVVSALGDTTDHLLKRAEQICAKPDRSTLAALLATGEAASSSLLALALNQVGIAARVFDHVQAGLRTVGSTIDADLISVEVPKLRSALRKAVVVLPGFIGLGENGATTLLGRGGSDYSALFLAHKLNANCVLVKDVDGIYSSDPATSATAPGRFAELKYETAFEVAGKLVQRKAIRFAAAHKVPFTVTSIGSAHNTLVGAAADRLAVTQGAGTPLRVALLGCGTVGGGVYQALAALPDLFCIIGVGTRTLESARNLGVPDSLITDDLEDLILSDCDVIIELIGGTKLAHDLIARGLRQGRHVVTANKALLAIAGDQLAQFAGDCGVTLRFSAAVGGVLPAIEAIRNAGSRGNVRGLSGVLNATTNFVLDRLAEGSDLKRAVVGAQEAGYAEANCRLDLNGTDAAHKLVVLAREAFGVCLPFNSIDRTNLEHLDPQWLRETIKSGLAMRFVATCEVTENGIAAAVKPVKLPYSNVLASVSGAENRLIIRMESGSSFTVSGAGAGRWPTTEAVIADLLDLRRELQCLRESQPIREQEVCA